LRVLIKLSLLIKKKKRTRRVGEGEEKGKEERERCPPLLHVVWLTGGGIM
jgi:hypothetical protein